jgi:hypothetical protein
LCFPAENRYTSDPLFLQLPEIAINCKIANLESCIAPPRLFPLNFRFKWDSLFARMLFFSAEASCDVVAAARTFNNWSVIVMLGALKSCRAPLGGGPAS